MQLYAKDVHVKNIAKNYVIPLLIIIEFTVISVLDYYYITLVLGNLFTALYFCDNISIKKL